MTKKSLLAALMLGVGAMTLSAASNILDIKHSITNDNVVPPESFETKTRELEENFYLKNFIDNNYKETGSQTGTPEEYEEYLRRLPVEIEMPYNSIVGKFINMYLGKRRRLVSDMLALHSYYGPMFKDALAKQGVPQELQYLPVIESAINPNAVSRAGAAGLWQFMPSTGTGMGLEVNSLVDQRRDPELSSREAARLLKQLYDIYEDWSLAIAAYNCGPGRVNQALRRAGGGKKDFWEVYKYLPAETRDYVPAFIAANYVMNYHDKYGIRPTVVKRPLVTDQVEVNDRIHFRQIAEVLNIPIEEIRMLNPQYRKDIIPGNHHPYMLTLPKQQCLSYIMSEEQIKNYDADSYAQRTHVEPGESRTKSKTEVSKEVAEETPAAETPEQPAVSGNIVRKTHIVGRGENIRDIAKKYGVSATDIKHWNQLRRGKVKEGDELVIEVVERSLAQNSTAVPAPRKQAASQETVVPMPAQRKATTQPEVPAPRQSSAKADDSSRKRYSTSASESTVSRSRQEKSVSSRTNNDRSRSQAASTKKNNDKKNDKKAKKEPPQPKTHSVAKGESLEKIAKKYNTTVEDLRKANGMKKDESMIRDGQSLKLPAKAKGGASVKNSKNDTKSTKKDTSSKKNGKAEKSSKSTSKTSSKKKK